MVVSIAAGVNIKKLEANLNQNARVIRVMPNAPLMVGMGMSAIVKGSFAQDKHIEIVKQIFVIYR